MKLNTIHHGEFQEVIGSIPDNYVDLILTDPPFGQEENNRSYGRRSLKQSTTDKNDLGGSRNILNDNHLLWLPDFAVESFRILKDNSYLIAFCQWRTIETFKTFLLATGFKLVTIGVWDKGNAGLGAGFAEGYENFLVFEKGNAPRDFFTSNLIREPRVTGRPVHPHQKPIKLIKKLLDFCSKKGYIVFDPFLGSGTTIYACKDMNRNYLGCELSKEYYDYIILNIKEMDSQGKLFNNELGRVRSKV